MNKYIKIGIIIIIVFIISQFLIKQVFLANSPKIKPNIDKIIALGIKNKVNQFLAKMVNHQKKSTNLANTTQQSFGSQAMTMLTNNLKPIAQGVSAASDNNNSLIEYKIEQIDWVTYVFNINGKEIKVKVPKGQEAPTQQMVEQLNK